MWDNGDADFQHILSPVIKQLKKIDGALTFKSENNFLFDPSSGFVKLDAVSYYPTGSSDFVVGNYEYDDKTNITQFQRSDGQPVSYIWGYDEYLPTAVSTNAGRDEIAYTSFEDKDPSTTANGGWLVNETGTIQYIPQGPYLMTSLGANSIISHAHISSYDGSAVTVSVTIPSSSVSGLSGELEIFDHATAGAGPIQVLPISSSANTLTISLTPGAYTFILQCSNCDINVGEYIELSVSYVNSAWSLPGFDHQVSGKTGLHVYELLSGNTISYDGMHDGEYILSYWQKNGTVSPSFSGGVSSLSTQAYAVESDGWQLLEYIIQFQPGQTGTIAINGNQVLIDELRLYPSDAQMSTYCYDKSLKLHTTTDANNQSSYYEYDGLGRLTHIRDFEGNIRSRNTYHYKQ